jgi:hypothetical protein
MVSRSLRTYKTLSSPDYIEAKSEGWSSRAEFVKRESWFMQKRSACHVRVKAAEIGEEFEMLSRPDSH